MKYALALPLCLLAGCASLDPYKGAAVSAIATANDRAAQDAELVLCRGISVGAWVRAYGQDAGKAQAWRVLCRNDAQEVPTPAP